MYRLIIADDKIVDACEGEPNWVMWQDNNRIWLSCHQSYADGIVTVNGEDIYTLEGHEVDGYSECEIRETDEETYRQVREELDAGDEIPAPDKPEPDPELPKTRIQILEEQVAELTATNYMLVECLLEMSEIVYGGDEP